MLVKYCDNILSKMWTTKFFINEQMYYCSRLRLETNVTKVLSIFHQWKIENNILFFHLNITQLCASWNHQRILKNKQFWKCDSWFPSEVSKFTLVRNMLDLPLKYWFMEAKVVFWYVMVPKSNQKSSRYNTNYI